MLDELHDRALLSFLLSRLEHYVPLLVPFPGLARVFLKTLLGLWGGAGAEAKSSGGGTEQEGEEAERVSYKERVHTCDMRKGLLRH